MRSRPASPPRPQPSDFFLVEITEDASAPEYEFVEVWDPDGTGTLTEKVGGRYGGADNPGLAVAGATFATGDYALAQPAEGNGNLTWHLVSLGGGGASPLTTKGDLYTRSSSADARLPVGTNGQVLTADSAQTLGVKWATPGAAITVEEADGSPSYSGSTTLRFDQADGFVVTNPSGTVARVDLASASDTQKGAVDTATQTFAGAKTFKEFLKVDQDTSSSGGLVLFGDVADASGSPAQANSVGVYYSGGCLALQPFGSTGGFGVLLGHSSTQMAYIIYNTTAGALNGIRRGYTGAVTVKVSGVDKTATFVGGILIDVS